jgi:hypothetical protein
MGAIFAGIWGTYLAGSALVLFVHAYRRHLKANMALRERWAHVSRRTV